MALVGVTAILGKISSASYSIFDRSMSSGLTEDGYGLRKENASKQKAEPGFDSIKAGIALLDSTGLYHGVSRVASIAQAIAA
jgi:hypothetical protein